jgi:5-deoxy-glucuronate isomerase
MTRYNLSVAQHWARPTGKSRQQGEDIMKYHALMTADKGLNTPSTNPCKLLEFGFLKLAAGETYTGESGEREVLAVLLGGRADFDVDGKCFEKIGGRPNVFNGKPHSVYIPAKSRFTITGASAVEIALPSAPSDLEIEPYVIAPSQVASGVWGAANFKRYYNQILTLASQPELPARRLIVGETFTPSGNWSTYPPHKHQVDDLPREAQHEEMYFFKVSPGDGFGICHYYNEEGKEENFTIRDNSIHMMPRGYHTVVSAPGYTTYYLWFLAGNQRVQGAVDDPQVGWVNKTVAMLKELGH